MLEIAFIPAFKDNYIWLLHDDDRNAAVVDPGDANAVNLRLKAEGFTLRAILVTHHHRDHQGGVAALLEEHDVPVYAPAAESITGCTVPLADGDSFDLLGEPVQVLAVPGHTKGHLAFLLTGQRVLFSGDALFGAGCGRVFEGNAEQMSASLAKLAALDDDTLVYCAHEYTEANLRFALEVEPKNRNISRRAAIAAFQRLRGKPTLPSTIAEERATNPFLRCHVPAVIAAAKKHDPECADDPVSVFAAIRAWKNVY